MLPKRVHVQDDDRRKYRRYETSYPVKIETSKGISGGLVKNISGEGAFVCCETPYEKDYEVKLIFEAPDLSPLHLTAKVIWLTDCDDGSRPFGMGVRIDSGLLVSH